MQTNYIEFPADFGAAYKKIYDDGEVKIYETDQTAAKKVYDNLYSRACKSLGCKPSQPKTYRQLIKDDVVYAVSIDTGEVMVYSLTPIYKVSTLDAVAYEKKKLSIINVQSTTSYDDILNASRSTFRISNRVFLNFEVIQRDGNPEQEYRVYVNYNHDQKVDWVVVEKDLARAIKLIRQGTTC